MANRISASDVEEIAEFDTLTSSDIENFIDDAETIIDDRLKGHTTDSQLKLIETYLAAHLASLREQRVSEETVGPVTMRYEGDEYGMGLKSTRYGQMAVELDPTGRLKVSNRYSEAVNTVPSDVTGFEDNYKAGQ